MSHLKGFERQSFNPRDHEAMRESLGKEYKIPGYMGFVRGSQHLCGRTYGKLTNKCLTKSFDELTLKQPLPQDPQRREKEVKKAVSNPDAFITQQLRHVPHIPGFTGHVPGIHDANTLRDKTIDSKVNLTKTWIPEERLAPWDYSTGSKVDMKAAMKESLKEVKYIPGYQGHVPGYRDEVSGTFGSVTSKLMASQPEYAVMKKNGYCPFE